MVTYTSNGNPLAISSPRPKMDKVDSSLKKPAEALCERTYRLYVAAILLPAHLDESPINAGSAEAAQDFVQAALDLSDTLDQLRPWLLDHPAAVSRLVGLAQRRN